MTPADTEVNDFGPKKRVFVPFACEDGQGQRRFSNPIVANLGHFHGPCIVEIASVVFTVGLPRQFFRFGLESWVQINRNFRSKSTGVELSYKVVSGLIRRGITCSRKL